VCISSSEVVTVFFLYIYFVRHYQLENGSQKVKPSLVIYGRSLKVTCSGGDGGFQSSSYKENKFFFFGMPLSVSLVLERANQGNPSFDEK